ncbi:MAG: tetratricopeptide repeat protein [Deltaproteobacteria bacterium]|nr:tetratricopeptide repeat protein [Deltaproteobacteria bacterium]
MRCGSLVKLFLCTAILGFVSCALPPDSREEQGFIPDDELQTVTLAREGLYYFGRSRYFDAEVRFRQALHIYPQADNLRINLALTLEQQGQVAEAEEIYLDLLSRSPDDTQVLAGLGRMYARSGKIEQASRCYQSAFDHVVEVEDWERATQFARSLSAISFKYGDEVTALCFSDQALSIRPNPAEKARHARLLLAMNYYDKARKLIGASAEGRAARFDALQLHLSAMAHYGLGKLEDALRLEEMAVDRARTSPGIEGEVRLVMFAAAGFKHIVESQDGQEQDSISELGDPVEAFFASGGHLTGAMIYWPVNLVEDVLGYAKQQGFYNPEGEPTTGGGWLKDLFPW